MGRATDRRRRQIASGRWTPRSSRPSRPRSPRWSTCSPSWWRPRRCSATRRPGRPSCGARSPALGLEPVDVPLDAAPRSTAHPGAAPFSWDVDGKANVVATWAPAPGGGRSLILNGHVDVVSPEPTVAVDRRPVRAPPRRRLDLRPRRGRHEGGARGDRRRRARRSSGSASRRARRVAAAVGRRGGVHRQRRAGLRARRPHGRRGDPHRADGRRRSGRRRSASCGSRCASLGAPAHAGDAPERRQRDRGDATR